MFHVCGDVWTLAVKYHSSKGRQYGTVRCRVRRWTELWMLCLNSCTNLGITFPLVFLLYEINVLIFELLLMEYLGVCR